MAYLVCDPEIGSAYVIDAPYDCTTQVLDTASTHGCSVRDILLTHTHWDHTADCARLKEATGANVFVHCDDLYRLTDPTKHTIWPLPFVIESVENAKELSGISGIVKLSGGMPPLRFIHTPGHTEGGVCFIDDVHRRVFVGDTLFRGSVGRVDLPGGDMKTLTESIRTKLFALDDDFEVCPGHGPTTTIARERSTNPFVGELAR